MSKYNNHPYNNHVIKVKTKEHGAKVIQWWKSQGVEDTDEYEGHHSEEGGYSRIYYGLYNGEFDNRNIDFTSDCKIIELPEDSSSSNPPKFVLPEYWCILCTEDNDKVISDYYNRKSNNDIFGRDFDKFFHSHNRDELPIMNGGDISPSFLGSEIIKGYTEITTKQFVEHVVNASSISAPSTKKEVSKDEEYYKSFIGREVVGISEFNDPNVLWDVDMEKYVGKKGTIISFDDSEGIIVEFPDGEYWYYPADLIIQQFESKHNSTTEIKIPAVQKVSTEIKPDLSKKIPEIKISLPEVKPKQIGRVLIEKVSIKI